MTNEVEQAIKDAESIISYFNSIIAYAEKYISDLETTKET